MLDCFGENFRLCDTSLFLEQDRFFNRLQKLGGNENVNLKSGIICCFVDPHVKFYLDFILLESFHQGGNSDVGEGELFVLKLNPLELIGDS